MVQTSFTASTPSGELGGWATGEGPPVLVLHGGPGLGYEYMDDVVVELATSYRVATFQQRGLPPSVLDGESTIAEAVAPRSRSGCPAFSRSTRSVRWATAEGPRSAPRWSPA